jgi:hypothetical protein
MALVERQMGQQQAAQEQARAEALRQQEIQQRQAIAQQYGIDEALVPVDDAWKLALEGAIQPRDRATAVVDGVVIDTNTGQPVYQAPQQMFRQVTGEEAASMGLDPSKAYNIEPNGKVTPIGEAGVVVNNNMGEDKFGGKLGELDAQTLNDVGVAGMSAQRNIGRIDQLEGLLSEIPTGAEANFKQIAGEFGISLGDDTSNIQAAQAMINTLIPEQRPPGSGPMSDRDVDMFKQGLPRMINQPGGNQIIINTMRGIAQYDAEGAAIVQQLRNGEIGRAEAFRLLNSRKNPLADFKAPAEASQSPPPGKRLKYNPATGLVE